MEKIAVFVNDVAAARHILQPMLQGAGPTHWVLVACPPTLTRHIGRWVSQGARQQWRERWAADLFDALQPELRARAGSEVETLIARKPLVDVSARLLARLPQLRLLDARQARVGRIDEPISAAQPAQPANRWTAPVAATAGLSLMLTLAD
jgi:hypothetical protein